MRSAKSIPQYVQPPTAFTGLRTEALPSRLTCETRIRREFQCFRSKWPEKPAFVSKIFAAVARFSDYQLSQIILSLVYPIILGLDRMVAPRITQMPS